MVRLLYERLPLEKGDAPGGYSVTRENLREEHLTLQSVAYVWIDLTQLCTNITRMGLTASTPFFLHKTSVCHESLCQEHKYHKSF